MSAVLVIYFVATGARAVALLRTGTVISAAMGLAMIVLPLIGAWALARELRFGWASTRLVNLLADRGRVPEEDIDVLPSGRPVREAAERVYGRYREEIEEAPDSWEAWARFGIMTDAIGDRREARGALLRAIRLERAQRADSEQ